MKCTFSLWWILIVGIIVIIFTQTNILNKKESFYYETTSPSTGVTNIVTTDSDGNLSSFPFPKGIIVMWSGELTSIPNGWSLCDGTNGTPDLRGRFVIGTNPSDSATSDKDSANVTLSPRPHKSKGGSEKVSLQINEMPRHKHDGLKTVGEGLSSLAWTWSGSNWSWGGNNSTNFTGGTAPSTGIADVEKNGDAHENMPPYYSLAYIMKM